VPAPPSRAVRLLIDLALVGWIVAWIVLGVQVGREVRGLTELSDTVVLAGDAIEQTGDLLEQVGRIPFLGQPVGDLADRIRETGRSAQRDAAATRSDVEDLSVLLALSIALIPTLPLLGLYLPLRFAWTNDARAVRRALKRAPTDPLLVEFLARRAVANFPYDSLLAVSPRPFRDLEEGRYDSLARLELDRLGIRNVSA
jgi:hypothetical protein